MEAAGKRYIVHPSRSNRFSIWGVGDIHLGAAGCDERRLQIDLNIIKDDPYSYWIGLGDYADYISPRDKRFRAGALDDEALLNIGRLGKFYAEKIAYLFHPVRHKCLGLLFGNHEEKYHGDHNQEDAHSWLCTELEVPNLRYCSLFDLVFIRKSNQKQPKLFLYDNPLSGMKDGSRATWRVYVHHGTGSAATPSGKLNALIKHMQNVEADIYMMGHVHEQKGQRLVTLGANEFCDKITEKHKIGVISGSYLRTYKQGVTGYGEMKGYAPTNLGAARIEIVPDKLEVRGEI